MSPSQIAQCCTRTTGRFIVQLPRWHQAFKPSLTHSFWKVRLNESQPQAFHTLPGAQLQKVKFPEAGPGTPVNRGAVATAIVTETNGNHGSERSSHRQIYQQKQQQDANNLTSEIENFLNRSGRRRRQQHSPLTTTSKAHKTPKSAKLRKRYEPAFQKGDFMCPQCGTHNFGDPDKHLRPFMARSIPRLSRPHEVHHRDESNTPQARETRDQDEAAVHEARPLRTRERRKRVQGANSCCVECGYSVQGVQECNTTGTRSASSETSLPNTSTTQNDDDHRISRPREFVCDYCDTVNFAGRISCVGCGAVTPRLRDK